MKFPNDLLFQVSLVVLLFFFLRELWCWYFKINRIEELLEKIVENTKAAEKKTDTIGSIDENLR